MRRALSWMLVVAIDTVQVGGFVSSLGACSRRGNSHACRGLGSGLRAEGGYEADTTLLQPPDRLEGLEAVGEAVDATEDGSLTSPLFPSMPEPPFLFQVPGEFGNPTLCTDPAWGVVLLTLRYLGIPYVVSPADSSQGAEGCGPALVCDDEYYDSPADFLAIVPERYVLSDVVESADNIQREISAVQPAFEALLANKDPQLEEKYAKSLANALGRIDFRLSRSKGDFIESDEVTLGDMHLAVSLYHMALALRQYKKWELPAGLTEVAKYMDLVQNMGIFKSAMPAADAVLMRYAR